MKKLHFFNYGIQIYFFMFLTDIFQSAYANEKFWIPKNPPKAHYIIEAKIDTGSKTIYGSETISFKNTSVKNISIIAINWTITNLTSLEIKTDNQPLTLLNYPQNLPIKEPLLYKLTKPVKPGSEIMLNLKFSSGEMIGSNIEQIGLINWYPRMLWDGIFIHESFEVKLDIPSGYALAISGKLNPKTGYYENDGVRTCGIWIGKGFKTKQTSVDDIIITSIFTEKGSECALLCHEVAVDAIKFYKDWLGFYPFKFLYIIPGADYPMGGYPFASGIVVIHGQEQFESKPLLHWKWITAHEIGHQYWGEYVMDDDYPSWLWIGMGIYADREYTKYRKFGNEKHKGLMNRYINGMKKFFDTTVDIPPAQFKKITFDHNNVVKHGKGFSIISALECVLGKESFENIYKTCLKEYGGKHLGYKEFWQVCERESGENLSWFFDDWVKSNKYVSYHVVSQHSVQKGKKYISNVMVENTGTLKMPLPVKAVFGIYLEFGDWYLELLAI